MGAVRWRAQPQAARSQCGSDSRRKLLSLACLIEHVKATPIEHEIEQTNGGWRGEKIQRSEAAARRVAGDSTGMGSSDLPLSRKLPASTQCDRQCDQFSPYFTANSIVDAGVALLFADSDWLLCWTAISLCKLVPAIQTWARYFRVPSCWKTSRPRVSMA